MLFRSMLALAAAVLSGCSGQPAPPPAPSPAAETVRQTAGGEVIGFVAENGVLVWRAIPFAAPPVGDLRWRAPRPPARWEGRREALEYASACPQLTNVFNSGEGVKPGELQGAEDCLYLNILAPAGTKPDAQLPVMVWIHGGGNVWGSAAQYDPSNLVANENVIIVSVQYRLGPLGWFAHEALRESAETAEDASPNFGTLDLIASLQWVKANIAGFGGDPARVTIFGESAGGQNVATLLASPLAKGLFERAIMQSGYLDSVSVADAEKGQENSPDAENAPTKVAARAGAADAAALRALKLDALYAAYTLDESGYLNLPRVASDGIVIPEAGLRATFATPGGFNAVPLISGTNRDEMKLFQIVDPRLVTRWFGLFPAAKDQAFYDRLAYYQSRLWRIRSIDEPLSAMTAAGHGDVWGYRFDWDEGGSFLMTDLKKLLGAAHGLEIPFVFNRFKLLGRLDPVMYARKTAADREALSRDMGARWAAFARDGEPGADWPRWGEGRIKRFDDAADKGPAILDGADSVDALIADLAADMALSPEQKKLVAGGLALWLPERAADFITAAE